MFIFVLMRSEESFLSDQDKYPYLEFRVEGLYFDYEKAWKDYLRLCDEECEYLRKQFPGINFYPDLNDKDSTPYGFSFINDFTMSPKTATIVGPYSTVKYWIECVATQDDTEQVSTAKKVLLELTGLPEDTDMTKIVAKFICG